VNGCAGSNVTRALLFQITSTYRRDVSEEVLVLDINLDKAKVRFTELYQRATQ
jgi:hypothetical protein